jgi:DNA polymerase III alpha subunit
MAFLTLEDKLSEIEIVVFARQYSRFADELFLENAVFIQGNISEEEGEMPKILLSDLLPLKSNSDFVAATLYIKIDSLEDKRLNSLSRIAMLNSGKTNVVVFDVSTKKYNSMKNVRINADEKTVERLKTIFGNDNVVLK